MTFREFHDAYLSGKVQEPRDIPADFRTHDQDAFVKWFLAAWPLGHEREYIWTIMRDWDAYISGWKAGRPLPNCDPL